MKIIWQTMIMAAAMRTPATMPNRRDTLSTPATKARTICVFRSPRAWHRSAERPPLPAGGERGLPRPLRPPPGPHSPDGERLLDQFLAALHLLGEVLVGGFLRHLEPGLVVRLGHLDHLDTRLLEGVDEELVALLRFLVEIGFRRLAGIEDGLLLLGRELLED